MKFSDRADPEKNKKDLNIYGSAARFNVTSVLLGISVMHIRC